MRVLLDENLPHKLRQLFDDNIEVVTVDYRGWKGKENGELLRITAVEFDAFITMDRSIPNQQNLGEINMGIVLLEADSNRFEDLAPLISQVNVVLKTLKNGQVVRVKPK
jgi:predicted nuclease of predicted toxin-antitoxin system